MSESNHTSRSLVRRCAVPLIILCLYGVSVGINMYRYTRGMYALYPVFAGKVLLVAKTFVGITEVSFGLLLLSVCRGCIMWLSPTWVGRVIDLNAAYDVHIWLAIIGLVAGTLHGICATTAYINIGKIPPSVQAAVGRVPKDVAGMLLSWNILSGWIIFVILVIAYLFAMRWPQQAPWLINTRIGRVLNNKTYFWITHHVLLIIFIPVAIVHSIKFTPGFPDQQQPATQLSTTKFLYYIAVALLIYTVDRLYRVRKGLRMESNSGGGDVAADGTMTLESKDIVDKADVIP